MKPLTYDTGALIAAEARNQDLWALHEEALERLISPVVPAGVLAQAWRGGPQPNLSMFLSGCVVEGFDEVRARRVGSALARARTKDVVDASVVIGALERGSLVVTSDPDDLNRIADALGGKLDIHAI